MAKAKGQTVAGFPDFDGASKSAPRCIMVDFEEPVDTADGICKDTAVVLGEAMTLCG